MNAGRSGYWNPICHRPAVQLGPKSLYSFKIVPGNVKLRRRLRSLRTRVREMRGVAWGLLSTRHPLLVHIIPIRR